MPMALWHHTELSQFVNFMDIFVISLLLIAGILGGILLLTNNKRSPLRQNLDVKLAPGMPAANADQQLDQQTRFVESRKRKQYRLLNDAEQDLYQRLCEAMPNMKIFAQVGVAQLAQLRGRREAKSLLQMATRGVDFVVCANDFSIIAAIELAWPINPAQESSSEQEKREALQSLGIPLIVFRPNKLPDSEAISLEIADAIVRRNRLEAERK